MNDIDHFQSLQSERAKEKLAAAKRVVDEALYELSGSQDGRDSEAAADAIENLIRVVMEGFKSIIPSEHHHTPTGE